MVPQSCSCPVGKEAMMAKVFLELHERESGLPSIKSRFSMFPTRQEPLKTTMKNVQGVPYAF